MYIEPYRCWQWVWSWVPYAGGCLSGASGESRWYCHWQRNELAYDCLLIYQVARCQYQDIASYLSTHHTSSISTWHHIFSSWCCILVLHVLYTSFTFDRQNGLLSNNTRHPESEIYQVWYEFYITHHILIWDRGWGGGVMRSLSLITIWVCSIQKGCHIQTSKKNANLEQFNTTCHQYYLFYQIYIHRPWWKRYIAMVHSYNQTPTFIGSTSKSHQWLGTSRETSNVCLPFGPWILLKLTDLTALEYISWRAFQSAAVPFLRPLATRTSTFT